MRLLCIHVYCMFVVEQGDRIVIDVGEFHCSSVFGITQLQWRLKTKERRTENEQNQLFMNEGVQYVFIAVDDLSDFWFIFESCQVYALYKKVQMLTDNAGYSYSHNRTV